MPMVTLGLFTLVVAGLAFSSTALAKKSAGAAGLQSHIVCADVYQPVMCDNGQFFGNECQASREAATGCTPYDDSTPVESAFKACPRDIQCPDVYNPVTCSNGVTYPNACYAYRACATGCGGGGT